MQKERRRPIREMEGGGGYNRGTRKLEGQLELDWQAALRVYFGSELQSDVLCATLVDASMFVIRSAPPHITLASPPLNARILLRASVDSLHRPSSA